jgi:hypothetical protein
MAGHSYPNQIERLNRPGSTLPLQRDRPLLARGERVLREKIIGHPLE